MRARTSRRGPHRRNNGAIGLIALCIVVPAVLLALRSSEPTTAAAEPFVAAAAASAATHTDTADVPPPVVATSLTTAATAPIGESAETATDVTPAIIEGCLIKSDLGFRLRDTAGTDAPRGRSWKSGFLHRSARAVDVTDARHRLNLSSHVGERVSVAGTLDDGRLQAESIKRTGESCK
jgi:hypothetical protein